MDDQQVLTDPIKLHKNLETCLNQLKVVTRINSLLSSDMHLQEILESILDNSLPLLQASAGSLMFIDDQTNTLYMKVARGLDQNIFASTRQKVGSGISGWVAMYGEPLLLLDNVLDPRLQEEMAIRPHIKDAICVPLKVSNKIIGVFNINNSATGKIFNEVDLRLLQVFADQAGLAVQKALTVDEMHDNFELTVAALAKTVDARDPYTFGHSRAVRDYSIAIASCLGFDAGRLEKLNIAALLHDIGKISISDQILLKSGPLTKDEYEIIKTHSVVGARIIEPIPYMVSLVPFVRHHHERYDGKGYPAGLKGDEIPLEARILAVADSFDAMTSTRAYRTPVPLDKILNELERGRNKQFDGELVDIFLREFKFKKKLKAIDWKVRDSAASIAQDKQSNNLSLFDLALENKPVESHMISKILTIVVDSLFEKLRFYTGNRIALKIESKINVFAMENGLPYLIKQGHLQIFADDTHHSLEIVKNFEGYYSFMERSILQITGEKVGFHLINDSLACLDDEQRRNFSHLFR